MPHKHNACRRHHIGKMKFKVTNWAEYEAGLRRRGSMTLWITPDALAGWAAPRRKTRGGQPLYSDLATETTLMLGMVFGLPDGSVHLIKAKEVLVAQPRQNPALDQQNSALNLCLVFWLSRPRRNDGGIVMCCHITIGAIDLRIVKTGLGDACLEIVRNQLRRHTAEELKGTHMAGYPAKAVRRRNLKCDPCAHDNESHAAARKGIPKGLFCQALSTRLIGPACRTNITPPAAITSAR